MYRFHASSRRIDWLYQQYGGFGAPDVDAFVRLVNQAYYRYFAASYSERHVADIEQQYDRLFDSLNIRQRNDWNIVDVGGGMGFEYDQFLRNGIKWKNYYFIEPDVEMVKLFESRPDISRQNVTILPGRLDDFVPVLANVPNKLYVFNSCLHHVIWIESVLDIIKSTVGAGDYLLLCHEPNNEYLGSPFMLLNYAVRCVTTDLLPRKLGLYRSAQEVSRRSCWQRINQDLSSQGVISKELPALVIRRIVDYGVGLKGDWRAIRVPPEFDEGHWTPDELAHYMGPGFKTRFLRTYRCLGDPARRSLWRSINGLLDRWFPHSGSVFCMAMERTEISPS